MSPLSPLIQTNLRSEKVQNSRFLDYSRAGQRIKAENYLPIHPELPPQVKLSATKKPHLTDTKVINYEGLGLETLTTPPLISLNRKIQQKTIAYCKNEPAFSSRQKNCEDMLHNLDAHSKIDPERSEWMGSDQVRRNITEHGMSGASSTPSVPVNLRHQTYTSEATLAGNVDFVRCGVFYHPEDPLHTVSDLEHYQTNPLAKESELNGLKIALNQAKVQNQLKKANAINHSIDLIENHLPSWIERKKQFLNDQMLHLVIQQVSSNRMTLPNHNGIFCLFHEALLNEAKLQKTDPSGLILDEKIFMKEMEETFARFTHTKLIFDGKGPYIDKNGHIHLEQKKSEKGKVYQLKLLPIFCNLTVQGSTKNNPIQKEMNQRGIEHLYKVLKKINRPFAENFRKEGKKLTESKKSNFSLAVKLFSSILDLRRAFLYSPQIHIALSCGCMSNKDRTSDFAEGVVFLNGVKPSIEVAYPDDVKTQKRLKKKTYIQMMFNSKEGITPHLIYENTKEKTTKVSAFMLPGMRFKDIDLIFHRIAYYYKQLKMFL